MYKNKLIRLITGVVVLAAAVLFEKKTSEIYITLALFLTAYLIFGGDVVWRALRNIAKGQIFDENFLMSLATCGAFALGEFTEAAGVMLFYQIGEYFQETAVVKSKKSIADLMDIRPDYANLLTDAGAVKIAPDTACTGDIILVKPGEKIPLDGVVIEGQSFLDTSALTGESVPRAVKTGDEALSGSVNQTGVLKMRVTKTFGESTVSKIINLVENAQNKKAKTENFITAFARVYTPVVVALAVLLAVLPPLLIGAFGANSAAIASAGTASALWIVWLRRALVFLVISCPCALVLSIPMSFFAGIGKAAKRGILVKGGNYLEVLNNLEIAVFDKTGTLTKGVFKVTDIQPALGYTENELLELAAHAEAYSNHPIALSILNAYGKEIDKSKLSEYTEIAGRGVSVVKDGKVILAGNDKLMGQGTGDRGQGVVGTQVYVAISEDINSSAVPSDYLLASSHGRCVSKLIGIIIISDEIKPDSKKTINALKKLSIKTVMLTGDNPEIAQAVAHEIGIDEVCADLLPHEKVEKVELLNKQKSEFGRLAFIGDGINDAPVLALADIGIAMGGLGSDAAIEAADVVLMTDEPSKLPEAISIAKFTKKIVWQNIIFALTVKTGFLVMGAFGAAGMWEAVFADVGVALLAVLNAMRIIR